MSKEPEGARTSRYEVLFKLASGGMATVYVGTARGAMGFRQLVAIKKPHAHLLDPGFRTAFVAEARLSSLLHHANVVDVRDIEVEDNEISLVMSYVEGASFGELLQTGLMGGPQVTPAMAVRVVLDACAGLHAAHELCDERGRPLQLVHRDISPQNLLLGLDGVTRVSDFGIAKFRSKSPIATSVGTLKGKLAYMAPEYLKGESFDRRFDIFAMGTVLWEGLTGRRLFRGEHEGETIERVLAHDAPRVAEYVPSLGTALDDVLDTALAKNPEDRFENAAAMAAALESTARQAGLIASYPEIAELVKLSAGDKLEERRALVRARLAHEPSVASVQMDAASAAALAQKVATKVVIPGAGSSGSLPSTLSDPGKHLEVSPAPGKSGPEADTRILPSDPPQGPPPRLSDATVPMTPAPAAIPPVLLAHKAGAATSPATTPEPRHPFATTATPSTLRSDPPLSGEGDKTIKAPPKATKGASVDPARQLGSTVRAEPSPVATREARKGSATWRYVLAIALGIAGGMAIGVFADKRRSASAPPAPSASARPAPSASVAVPPPSASP